jgi:hypothetical protein
LNFGRTKKKARISGAAGIGCLAQWRDNATCEKFKKVAKLPIKKTYLYSETSLHLTTRTND